MKSIEKIDKRLNNNLHICVGLDTDSNKIPKFLQNEKDGVFKFNKEIIEATKDAVCAYKINLAFYEEAGSKGIEDLEKTLEIIPDDIFVIGDAKRGDIGNTSKMYAKSLFEYFNFDASTLHPYMGIDSLEPFISYSEKINFILALTSNPSNKDFEKLKLENGKFLFQEIIEKVNNWNKDNNLGIVFGATNPKELYDNVESFKNLYTLLPGVGSQGGSLEDVVKAFNNVSSKKYIVNVSRAILYASSGEDFAETAAKVLDDYNNKVFALIK